ncbi:hypothetical protein GCM10023174_24690 [Chelativorans composti]
MPDERRGEDNYGASVLHLLRGGLQSVVSSHDVGLDKSPEIRVIEVREGSGRNIDAGADDNAIEPAKPPLGLCKGRPTLAASRTSAAIDPAEPDVEVNSTCQPTARSASTAADPIPREPPTTRAVFAIAAPPP